MNCEEWKDNLSRMGCRTLVVDDCWKTPASDYPVQKIGSAEVCRGRYDNNLYLMEGVKGFDFWCNQKRIPVTILKIDGKQWMVDDPLHQTGMSCLAAKSKGRVLVGGLGLGLVVHELVKNPKVERIDVVELNDDVIKLIGPQVPKSKVHIHKGNVYDEKWDKEDFDTIILDLWVRGRKQDKRPTYVEMLSSVGQFKYHHPKADVFVWGMRDSGINPAVEKSPCKFYKEIISNM